MRVLLDDLPKWARKDVFGCSECRKYDSSVFLCGWHENVAAGAQAVQAAVEASTDELRDR